MYVKQDMYEDCCGSSLKPKFPLSLQDYNFPTTLFYILILYIISLIMYNYIIMLHTLLSLTY